MTAVCEFCDEAIDLDAIDDENVAVLRNTESGEILGHAHYTCPEETR